jgi:Trk K+ transport system NAD-binding subunit
MDLALPPDCLVAAVIRDGQVVVPRGDNQLEVADRLLLVALPENQDQALRILTGEEA